MAENIHSGHRKRMRKEVIQQDFHESIPDHKVLEVLLYYGIPQKDTNELAHTLINTFGSLTAVFEADADLLFQVKGMTERSVALIKLILPLCRRYNEDRNTRVRRFSSVEKICEHLIEKHQGFGREVSMLTCLDESGNIISCEIIAKGNSVNVSFEVKDVVVKALKHKAVYVILSHNHMTGIMTPSQEDVDATNRLSFTLKEVGIRLIDHIVVTNDNYLSMAKKKYILPDV